MSFYLFFFKGRRDVSVSNVGVTHAINEYYFLTDPDLFIYNHRPENSDEWQLLARPVSLSEYKVCDNMCSYVCWGRLQTVVRGEGGGGRGGVCSSEYDR